NLEYIIEESISPCEDIKVDWGITRLRNYGKAHANEFPSLNTRTNQLALLCSEDFADPHF
ncbi:MAG: hypothetical protein NXI00_23735, partial [Cytophagales bacterium]|nr:hypothetical protein [Cytophagales bacterium]